jgi:hypothetical protein
MLTGNPWDCISDLTWLVDEAGNSSVARRVMDRDKMICNNETHPKKPVLPIMVMLKVLNFKIDTCSSSNDTRLNAASSHVVQILLSTNLKNVIPKQKL